MRYRKGVFAIVFSKNEYLLLHRILHWNGWELLKGGIRKNETLIKCLKREVKEETGLKIKRIIDMKKSGKFKYPNELSDRPGISGQTWHLYAVEVCPGKVKIDKREHSAYRWEKYNIAYKLLTWPDFKKCLKLVNSRIS